LRPSDVRKQSLGKAAAKYAENVSKAASYLQDRGVSEATATAVQLGVVVDPEPGHEEMVGRLSIPYITRAGVVDIKFRCLKHDDCKQEGCVKYLAIAGMGGSRLYNVNAFFEDSPFIGLTEGEIDADILHYEVGIPAVGCPGAQRWEDHFARCFTGYERVLVFADGDTTGRDFAKRVANELLQATVINLPQDQDVNSVFLLEGPERLRERAGLG
jgi:DNA primase